ncbi:hypothetical protein BD414DRAFT_476899 [Trametes punicea]|nr:hypothetical protein BD414DRAFT_476899 [Trametes punicea]
MVAFRHPSDSDCSSPRPEMGTKFWCVRTYCECLTIVTVVVSDHTPTGCGRRWAWTERHPRYLTAIPATFRINTLKHVRHAIRPRVPAKRSDGRCVQYRASRHPETRIRSRLVVGEASRLLCRTKACASSSCKRRARQPISGNCRLADGRPLPSTCTLRAIKPAESAQCWFADQLQTSGPRDCLETAYLLVS